MTWTALAPAPADTLVADIARVTTPHPFNVLAPTSADLLNAAAVVINAGGTDLALAESLRNRALNSPAFRPLYIKVADAIS